MMTRCKHHLCDNYVGEKRAANGHPKKFCSRECQKLHNNWASRRGKALAELIITEGVSEARVAAKVIELQKEYRREIIL